MDNSRKCDLARTEWMPESAVALEARQLTKHRGGRFVLDRLDLRVQSGEVLALLGTNGCGKTTLLRCLAGTLRPTSGQVRWFGQPVLRRPALRRLVGVVAHDSLLYPELTAYENLLFAARMYQTADPAQRTTRWLAACGLERSTDQLTGRLSRGQRQRLSIARGLLHDPRLVLLDEPFTGLDEASAGWLEQVLDECRRDGRTVCMATHDLRRSQRLADRVVTLRSGQLSTQQTNSSANRQEPSLPRSA